MQDLTSAAAYYHQSMMMTTKQPELPEQEQLTCPRCDSPNTKFCYYNNYNLSQPRHYCKNCRRYWTKGGSLRKIPVGGGSRKSSKRSGSSSISSNLKIHAPDQKPSSGSDSRDFGSGSKLEEEEKVTEISGQEMDPTRMLYGLPVGGPSSGSFSSLLAWNMQLGRAKYETGSSWYPDTDLDLGSFTGLRRSDDALAKNKVENN